MAKNLKRSQVALAEAGNATPNAKTGGAMLGGLPSSRHCTNKRHKQQSIRAFLQSPAIMADTPVVGLARPKEWPTTAQRALENLKVKDTPQLMPPPPARAPQPGSAFTRVSADATAVHAPGPLSNGLGRDAYGDEDDDFCISMSQTYERSQPDPAYRGDVHQDPELSLGPSQHYYACAATQHYQDVHDAGQGFPWILEGQGSSQPGQPDCVLPVLSAPRGQPVVEQDVTAPLPCTSAGPAVTPELGPAVGPDLLDDGTTPPPGSAQQARPFNIFLPRSRGQKSYVLVRHGQSEYNLAQEQSRDFCDPQGIFDARLTDKGKAQAQALQPRIAEIIERHGEDVLFVVSALSRAMETFLHMLPCPERLDKGCAAPLNVVISPIAYEHISSGADVGRPRSALVADFPQLDEPLSKLPERWWHGANDMKRPNCGERRMFNISETNKAFEDRVFKFKEWLSTHKQKVVVVVGHGCFFKKLAHQERHMRNCEMCLTTLTKVVKK